MLTRIYGTAFFSKSELEEHLERLEQARLRDHRRLGRELELFMFSELSPGSPFWKPAGMAIWNALTDLWRTENRRRGYREVRTPILYDVELFKQSGHWDTYRDHMYFTDVEERPMALKPMNCPAHILIYKDEPPLLPRPADPLLRGRARPSPRAQRNAPRADARATHNPGRRAHLLHRRAGAGGGRPVPALRLLPVRAVRLRAAPGAVHAPREADRQRRDVGPRRGGARGGAGGRGPRVRTEPRRRRLLRTEDRPAHDRLARSLVAARHGPAGLLDARALRPRTTRAPTTRSTAR